MLDIKYIREHQDEIRQNIKKRNAKVELADVLEADEERRKIQTRLDNLKSEQHKANTEIAAADPAKKQEKLIFMKKLATEVRELEAIYRQKEEIFFEIMEAVPNLTHPDVPEGKSDKDNKEIEKVGEIPKFSFPTKDHVTLGNELDLIDFDSAAEAVGQKFYYLKNEAVLLELALVNFAVNLLKNKGYTPIITPDLARKEIIKGAGFNPRDNSDQIYNIQATNLSLIATAEITVGGYYADHILDNIPLKFVGISHCFRKEAGSYGQESKGLYRVHQFTKVEMYVFCKPEDSEKMHQELLNLEKEIFTALKIPFRVVDVCSGDLGGPAYRKYDLEAWMPMKNGYGEITSTSNCTDFQARRLNIKYKDENGKNCHVHTLNGTAIAVSRALIAILENFQQPDGSIIIPEVLRPYMANISVIKPRK
jgi:seryl-tRNA synthetase